VVKSIENCPNPDLVDLIFEYIVAEFPEISGRAPALKNAARKEFAGIETYIAQRSPTERQAQINQIMCLFNGRNATEIARRLQISRATVYRLIKTAGR
jgi:Mor family transcriptional regulator